MQRSIFITGAAAGIGREVAIRFAREGFFVGLYDVDEKGAKDLGKLIGEERTHAAGLDVRDWDGWQRTVRAFGEASGQRMDVLFNNAGILRMGWFEDVSPEECKKEIDINVLGVVYGVHASLPLLERTSGACIVNMSSESAVYGAPELAVYSATKFAVRGLTEALDLELRRKGIRCCDVMPPYVDTGMVRNQTHHAKSLDTFGVNISAQDVAEHVWKAHQGR
jgi:NAD(P)-dependent dehydrogenase (short-subunit alcohol dehydrogenase family)